jgi:hypothetical protein
MKRTLVLALALLAAVSGQRLRAFCGFYVGKADSKLFNHSSQVALVREGDHTVLTMANDFQGDPKEFALVVPVPTFIERRQIEVVDKALLDHLDAFSAPRLVEYFDEDPCRRFIDELLRVPGAMPQARAGAKKHGVTIEATYTVGEYDILILSARESTGLETWLRENGYKIPSGAAPILGSYINQGMRFFVARVNLKEKAALGFTFLRPLQVAYDSPKFMLPIRLGTVNAQGTQDLFVFALTHRGRVETTNYRTVKLPTGMDVPLFVKAEFKDFYTAMFAEQVRKEDMRAVFLEYAWDTAWCDPCAADPLSPEELRKLGVSTGGGSTFVSRLHVRYDAAHFPEDLVFQETADRENFQGRYVLRHAWHGEAACAEAAAYRTGLARKEEQEAQNLAHLTGWSIDDIRRKARGVKITLAPAAGDGAASGAWYRRLWAAATAR